MKYGTKAIIERFIKRRDYAEYRQIFAEYITEFDTLEEYISYIAAKFDFKNSDYEDIDNYCLIIASNIYVDSCMHALMKDLQTTHNIITEKYTDINNHAVFESVKGEVYTVSHGFELRRKDDLNKELYLVLLDKKIPQQALATVISEIKYGEFNNITANIKVTSISKYYDSKYQMIKMGDLNYDFLLALLDKAE